MQQIVGAEGVRAAVAYNGAITSHDLSDLDNRTRCMYVYMSDPRLYVTLHCWCIPVISHTHCWNSIWWVTESSLLNWLMSFRCTAMIYACWKYIISLLCETKQLIVSVEWKWMIGMETGFLGMGWQVSGNEIIGMRPVHTFSSSFFFVLCFSSSFLTVSAYVEKEQ